MEISKRLAASDPDSTQAQRDLMVSHYNLANTHLANDELPAALAGYQLGWENAQFPRLAGSG